MAALVPGSILIFLFKIYFLFIVCVYIYVNECHVCGGARRSQKRVSDPLS